MASSSEVKTQSMSVFSRRALSIRSPTFSSRGSRSPRYPRSVLARATFRLPVFP